MAAGCVLRSRLDRASCRQGSNAGGGDCTTRQRNAHRTVQREVLYPWHPWAGCTVQIHEVIEKASGDTVRCGFEAGAAGRCLELPAWMLDRAACFGMRLEVRPQVTTRALSALVTLLAGASRNMHSEPPISIGPVAGAVLVSRNQNRGETNATPAPSSSECSNSGSTVRPVRSATRVQRQARASVEHAAGRDAADGGAADSPAADRARRRQMPAASRRRAP